MDEDSFGGGLVGVYEDTALSSPVDSFYLSRESVYSNDYGTGLSSSELMKYDTYTVAGDGGLVSGSWDISESPDSGYIWYIIDSEICPKLFGVGDGKQKNDSNNGSDGSGNESNGSEGGNSNGGGNGSGNAEIREEPPVPYGAETAETEGNISSGGYSADIPELKPINSLSVLGLFALGISVFVIVWRKNEDDDSTV